MFKSYFKAMNYLTWFDSVERIAGKLKRMQI